MIDDERICPKAHDSVRCLPFDRTDETHARTRARSFLKLRRHRRINIRNPLHPRIVYLVLMAASRITTRAETFPCTSHTGCLSPSLSPPLRSLGIVHNETRYPRLVSRPIKQLGSTANREVEKSDYNDLEHWPSIEETTP